jgi:hypothetical protein
MRLDVDIRKYREKQFLCIHLQNAVFFGFFFTCAVHAAFIAAAV